MSSRCISLKVSHSASEDLISSEQIIFYTVNISMIYGRCLPVRVIWRWNWDALSKAMSHECISLISALMLSHWLEFLPWPQPRRVTVDAPGRLDHGWLWSPLPTCSALCCSSTVALCPCHRDPCPASAVTTFGCHLACPYRAASPCCSPKKAMTVLLMLQDHCLSCYWINMQNSL